MATLTFWGATAGVTGSAYLIETAHARILLECGLVQGSHEEEKANREAFPFELADIDAVVLSHAHLDHSGRLPKLVAEGYQGDIHMTAPTSDLLEVMLMDAAFLEERDVEWENKRRRRAGKPLREPLYTIADAEATFALCRGHAYGRREPVAEGIEVCFRDAGHILGSAIVELYISEHGSERKLVFSGDLGNSCAALLRDPEVESAADVLLLESTYGDRDHRSLADTLAEFEDIVTRAGRDGGNVLIPSFAVGRAQEVIFRLGEMYQKGRLPQRQVYLDSPMAIATTEIYHRYQNMFNRDDAARLGHGADSSLHRYLPVLRYSRSAEESMALNRIQGGAIIIAGSGMCNGGRIRHHFKHNLWRHDTHVVIVGFQARGTPGRALVDGAKTFHMGGEEIAVNATIHTLGGFSAHASQSQLLDWVAHFKAPRPRLYLVHGEDDAKAALSARLGDAGWHPHAPGHGETIEL